MAGGAVTIEELILGLQGSLGSTPEAFCSAAEHLLRIGGWPISPLLAFGKPLRAPLYTHYTQYCSEVQVS